MRGKPAHYDRKRIYERITPAHAGKTGMFTEYAVTNEDHPRTCGENLHIMTENGYMNGSPPHMRGKPEVLCYQITDDRITPAHAGKTSASCSLHIPDADHPRTCGENRSHHDYLSVLNGSPPHMRGKLSAFAPLFLQARITPAHAGKTFKESDSHRGRADHPRTCGENSVVSVAISATPGSPPHMRGKHDE